MKAKVFAGPFGFLHPSLHPALRLLQNTKKKKRLHRFLPISGYPEVLSPLSASISRISHCSRCAFHKCLEKSSDGVLLPGHSLECLCNILAAPGIATSLLLLRFEIAEGGSGGAATQPFSCPLRVRLPCSKNGKHIVPGE